jgi:putative acetyltransferase
MQEPDIIIRKIEERDNPYLAKVIRDTFTEHDAPREGTVYSDPTTDDLFALFRKSGSVLWIAEVAGKAEGCCGIYPTEGLKDKHVELVKFYLSPAIRGKGIGRQLLSKTMESARQYGYKYMYLESLPQFAKAVNMYKKSGFGQLKHPLGDSGHRSCNIWMIKKLDAISVK